MNQEKIGKFIAELRKQKGLTQVELAEKLKGILMMNELFENEYIMETKFFKEYVYNILCKKHIIIGLVIAVIGIILFAFLNDEKSYIILVIAIISGAYSILIPIITTKQLEKMEATLNNGKIEKTNIKFQKNIVMNEGKVHLEIEYNQIIKIMQTKNFIVLKISENSAILVLKNGFLKGNEKDFIKFIEHKINN